VIDFYADGSFERYTDTRERAMNYYFGGKKTAAGSKSRDDNGVYDSNGLGIWTDGLGAGWRKGA
jgi:hypothetical protein